MTQKNSAKQTQRLKKPSLRLTSFTAVTLAAIVAAMSGLIPDSATSKVAFVRDCPAKDGGDWNWGEAPSGCEASRFGDTSRIKFIYHDFVFDRTTSTPDEHRKDYVTAIHALLRDLSTEYIKAKKPDVQDDEVKAFVEAIEAVAHQETYWSHYRVGKDGRYKLMTGDKNISHGMMQINQKYHASKERDTSFDLVGNVGFGIEHFYLKWEMASRARCINRVKNQKREQTLVNITRAAYAAYNGGSDAICRWTNPKHPWFKNDKNYYGKLTGKKWSEWVRAEDHRLSIDLACIRSGDELCAIAKERKGEYIASRPLLLEDGSTCIVGENQQLECARDLRVFTCLAALTPDLKSGEPLKISALDSEVAKLKRRYHDDRMTLCQASNQGFALIGDAVITKQDLAVRSSIGGRVIGYAKKGLGFQVLDIEVSLDPKAKRHYRIRLNPKTEGWIDAGTADTASKLLTVEAKSFGDIGKFITPWLPTKGSMVEIVKADGVKLLVAPETASTRAEVKGEIAKGATPVVEEIKVLGAANEIWLKVKNGQDVGYIFAGRTYPTTTVQEWVKVK